MVHRIDVYCFEKCFDLFIDLVEEQSKAKFISFPANRYTEENEGYKDEIYEKARDYLQFWNWKEDDIGSGEIVAKVVSAIELEGNMNNLVDWRLASKFKEKAKDENKIREYERALFDFYLNIKSDKDSFDDFIEHFGKNYPLIAYLFFIKDKAQYMPISPTNFEIAFEKLGVDDFKTSHQCSWSNYAEYNQLIHQVKDLLISKGVKDVSLLNAHSFVWIIVDVEKQLDETGFNYKEKTKAISSYKILDSKDKETVIKARIGQGIFREWLIEYWGKSSVTGCTKTEVLIASHIKPWRDCDNEEAIDVFNGLLLTPNIDKLFDMGLISFEDNGNMILSSELNNEDLTKLGVSRNMKISKTNEKHIKYLKHHREKVFRNE
ncbi:HNH endonuclease [Patescibacteria group bacterium]|nr:HNH endonuclease [Patescibacteria group bacterium]